MKNAKILVAGIVGLAAAGGGIAAATVSSSPSHASTVVQAAQPASSPSTIHAASVSVNGKTESILEDAKGLPLYTYAGDNSTRSAVSGGLAALWPPLVSTAPTESGAKGQVAAVVSTNGSQVQYDGHFLYTFVSDTPGHVTGQGVQNFFVATASGSSSPAAATPKPAPSYSYSNPY